MSFNSCGTVLIQGLLVTMTLAALLPAQVVGERRCPIIDTWWQTEVRTSCM